MSAQERLTDSLYGLGWGVVKKLPEPVAVRLGRSIADLAWKQRGKGVLRLESNYARVVPDASPERLAELSRAGMRSYLRYWMESFRLPAWSKERIKGGFDPKDLHYLTEGLAAYKGVIPALPHMANWDLAGCLGHHQAGDTVHDGRRAAQAGDAVRPFRRLPRGPGDGGAPAQRRHRLRHAGPAAA